MEIDAFRLRHIVKCIEAETRDPDVLATLFQRSGLSSQAIRQNAASNNLREPFFVNEACALLDDPTFAARAGLSIADATSLTSYIAKHSADLRSAIESSARYYSIFDPAFSFSLHMSGNAASFEISCTDPDYAHLHRHKEFLLFGSLARCRVLTQTHFYPIEMRFDHEVKSAADALRKLAGCPVVFGAEKTEMILSLASLELPIPTCDPKLCAYLVEYADGLMAERNEQEPNLPMKVKSILSDTLPGRIASAEVVAANLGMSKRTLARRLNETGISFRQIVDEVRCDLAKIYLKDSLGLSEIAFYLDYADQSAFSTAFRRWTGHSPKDFRSKQIGAGSAS